MHTYRQLYAYANMVFATSVLKFATRIMIEMQRSFKKLKETAPQGIKDEISKGSYYQMMLEKMIQNQQEQFYTNIQKFTYGDFDPPKMDLDIYFISPKIIINESLMHYPVMN